MNITSWSEKVCDSGVEWEAHVVERRDLARGMSGALFVSLPLLFTMEMWQIARTIPDSVLLLFLLTSYVFNRYFIGFAGFRKIEAFRHSPWWDAVVVMGIGFVASAVTLYVAGIITPDLTFSVTIKTIALETIPTSMGAAVAINQMGAAEDSNQDRTGLSKDGVVVVGTLLGGFLFAFNVAPTIEPKVIVLQQDWLWTFMTFLLSLGVSYMIVTVACFDDRDFADRKYITSAWLETLLSYLLAFIISLLLLWVFGYSTPLDPIEVWLPLTIVLAYATTLGGAAGKIVL